VDATWIYVANRNNKSIAVFPINASGDVAPTRLIQGANTTLDDPYGIAVDANYIYVANRNDRSIAVFPINASGDVVPTRSIKGPNSTLGIPWGIAVDENWIYVTIAGGLIASFPINTSGDVAPTRLIQGDLTSLYNPSGIAVIPSPITLTSPSEQAPFDACSLYSLPTFAWNATETFKSYEIQFSPEETFDPILVKVKTSTAEIMISSGTWKKVVMSPGEDGGTVFWRIVGTKTDKTKVISDSSSMIIEPAHAVEAPNISPTKKVELPVLSWENNCNVKFKVWFGNEGFEQKTSLSFSVKNPGDNGGVFAKALRSSQWASIRKLVDDQSGRTIFWYVESWDKLKRYSATGNMSFVLTDE
jgi:hypothetical protein